MNNSLNTEHLKRLIETLNSSRVRLGQAAPNSIDFELRNAFHESRLSTRIDISNFNELPDSYQAEIKRHHIKLK